MPLVDLVGNWLIENIVDVHHGNGCLQYGGQNRKLFKNALRSWNNTKSSQNPMILNINWIDHSLLVKIWLESYRLMSTNTWNNYDRHPSRKWLYFRLGCRYLETLCQRWNSVISMSLNSVEWCTMLYDVWWQRKQIWWFEWTHYLFTVISMN